MTSKKWAELIEEKYDEILEEMGKADKDALWNQHLQIDVYIDENGTVYTFDSAAGSNDISMDYFRGEAYRIKSFCYQYDSYEEYIEESIFESVTDDVTLEKICNEAEEAEMPIVDFVETSDKYRDIYEQAKEETIDWILDNAYEYYRDDLSNCVICLEEEAKHEEEYLQYRY